MDKGTHLREKKFLVRLLLRVQIAIGVLFVLLGTAFPFIVIHQHGTGSREVYDRYGAVIGAANYLLLAVGMGLISIAMGSIAIMMARKSLRNLNNGEN